MLNKTAHFGKARFGATHRKASLVSGTIRGESDGVTIPAAAVRASHCSQRMVQARRTRPTITSRMIAPRVAATMLPAIDSV